MQKQHPVCQVASAKHDNAFQVRTHARHTIQAHKQTEPVEVGQQNMEIRELCETERKYCSPPSLLYLSTGTALPPRRAVLSDCLSAMVLSAGDPSWRRKHLLRFPSRSEVSDQGANASVFTIQNSTNAFALVDQAPLTSARHKRKAAIFFSRSVFSMQLDIDRIERHLHNWRESSLCAFEWPFRSTAPPSVEPRDVITSEPHAT